MDQQTQQTVVQVVIGLGTMASALWLVETGEVSGTVGLTVVVGVATALGVFVHRSGSGGDQDQDQGPDDGYIMAPTDNAPDRGQDDVPSADNQSIPSSVDPDEPVPDGKQDSQSYDREQ